MGAVGYSVVAVYSAISEADAQRLHTYWLACAALGCWIGYVVTRTRDAMLGGSIALACLWLEVHLSFVIAAAIPSTGLLATPVLVISAGLVFGSRVALVTAISSIAITTPLYLLSPAAASGPLSDASVFWLVVHGIVTIAAWALITQSLAALQRILAALTDRETELEAVIRDASDGILIIDRDERIRVANPSAERMLGLRPQSAVGTPLGAALSGVGAEDAARLVRRLSDEGGNFAEPEPWVLRHSGMPAVHIEVTQRATSGGRRELMLRDVTPRVAIAASLRESEHRLAHAQRLVAVGQLAGGIAHDFNNLLLAIGGNIDLLRDERDESMRNTLLDELDGAQERGAPLTRQLLGFARKEVHNTTVFELGEVVEGVQRLLQRVGDISIDSVPGRGTTITVKLPHANAPVSLVKPARVIPPVMASNVAHILVADDDDSTRAVVGRILQRAVYVTTLVADGEQALRALQGRAEPFALIITDVVMPVMNGPVFAARARELDRDVPILFMSGYAETGFAEFAEFDHKRDFLAKPFGAASSFVWWKKGLPDEAVRGKRRGRVVFRAEPMSARRVGIADATTTSSGPRANVPRLD